MDVGLPQVRRVRSDSTSNDPEAGMPAPSHAPSRRKPFPYLPAELHRPGRVSVAVLPFADESAAVPPVPSLNAYAACANAGSGLVVNLQATGDPRLPSSRSLTSVVMWAV